jgi:hypothetical protein
MGTIKPGGTIHQGLRLSAARYAHIGKSDRDLEIVVGQCAIGK